MNLAHPLRSIVPTLDAPVLEVLAGTTRPLSGHQVFVIARTGSPRGIRLVLARLVAHGVVLAEVHPGATLYAANRKHLAWPAIEALAGLRGEMLDQIRTRMQDWRVAPVHASVFGSTSRGGADEESDLDLLLVRPDESDGDAWERQMDDLRDWVLGSTGNRCQTFDVDVSRFAEHVAARDPLVDAWRRDGVHLAGVSIEALVRSSRKGVS
jgi:predicted nucleotidyltransferase